MPFVIEIRDNPPKGKHSKGRGAPYGIVKHRKFLLKNRGKWGMVSNESSKLAAKLVSQYWKEKFAEDALETIAVGRQVWARYPFEDILTDTPRLLPSEEPTGASVRAPGEEKEVSSEEYTPPPKPQNWSWAVISEHYYDDELMETCQSLGTYWREYTRRHGTERIPGPDHDEADFA